MVECLSSASRGIDNFESWACQSPNSKSSWMDRMSFRSCGCCCHVNFAAWSSFIYVKKYMKNLKVFLAILIADYPNHRAVVIFYQVFTCLWWMNLGLSYLGWRQLLPFDRYLHAECDSLDLPHCGPFFHCVLQYNSFCTLCSFLLLHMAVSNCSQNTAQFMQFTSIEGQRTKLG